MRQRKATTAKMPKDRAAESEPSARERLLAAAGELFYRQGIRSVGVDEIVAKADVAKMSLYRSFPSKDELAAAYLEAVDRRYWRWWDDAVARHRSDPNAALRTLFRGLVKRTTSADWRGCPFTNAATEFPEPDHPARRVAEANKRELRRRFVALTRALGARRPAPLADQLVLLFEGAYASAQTFGPAGPAASAAEAAQALVTAAVGAPKEKKT